MPDTVEPSAAQSETIVERARALKPLLRERAAKTERARRVLPESIEAIRETGLFQLLQPRIFGGFEGDFTTLAEVNFELSSACGSTGWVGCMLSVHQWLAAHFPVETQQEIWGDDPNSLVSGAYYQAARAVPENGGYRVSGSWRLTSGVDNSQWTLLGVVFPPETDDGPPVPGFLMVSDSERRIDDDWHAVGLAGTGSKTVVVDDKLIPAHRRVTFAELNGCTAPGGLAHDNSLYNIPLLTALAYTIATPALGILKGAIEEFIDLTRPRNTYGAVVTGGSRVAEFAAVQSKLGEAQASFNAGRALVMSDLEETQREAHSEAGIGLDRRIHNRLSQAFIVKLARQGVELVYDGTGGTGLYLDQPLQRAWRDVNAISHHVSLNWDAVSSMAGQHALGLEPKGQY